jgi:lipopolysaccharide/colanic/teichoic acid biosynthesis glycosyltransferase
VLALVALAIVLESTGPALYYQNRRGQFGRVFTIVKFRTMIRNAEIIEVRAPNLAEKPLSKFGRDDPRLTRIGSVLRRYGADELPQLCNVVIGEMSLVGPRPLILSEAAALPDWSAPRLLVRPGVTGPWQAQGPHTVPLNKMLELDCRYRTESSFSGDLRIMWTTLINLVFGRHAL